MDKKKVFVVVGILWIFIIIGFIGYKEYVLRTGQEILLKTSTVSVSNGFLGGYLELLYEIGHLDKQQVLLEKNDLKIGDIVYVALDIAGGYAVATGVYVESPRDRLFIKGRVRYTNKERIGIDYGIGNYFAPEAKLRNTKPGLRRNPDVRVVINESGDAMIKELLTGR